MGQSRYLLGLRIEDIRIRWIKTPNRIDSFLSCITICVNIRGLT